jgi:hypothetical protein
MFNADGKPIVYSHAGDDPIKCKDYVRGKLGMPAFKPNKGNGADRPKPQPRIIASYDYTDTGRDVSYQVVKYDPKGFRQRQPDGNGGWLWKSSDRRTLYRLPDLKKFPSATVFVTEGEKDSDRIASLGHCATTVAMGAWAGVPVMVLAGRVVVIVEDNDEPGRKKALEAAQALHGTAKSIRIVVLPGLGPRLPHGGKDVSDWLDDNTGNAGNFVDVCWDTPLWLPGETVTDTGHRATSRSPSRSGWIGACTNPIC